MSDPSPITAADEPTPASVVLGIETSCDETAASVVIGGRLVRSSVVSSQVDLHARYGGVVPEIASRAHLDLLVPVVAEAMVEAGVEGPDVDAVAATHGPGLIGALLVGVSHAKALALVWDKPFVAVNHLEAHLYASFLEEPDLDMPVVVLLVSGGHTLLARLESTTDIRLIGSTVDDSVGEAYDKVARMLGLGYPGGPAIDRLAPSGTPQVRFPRPMLRQGLDFSFSGLKSAVERYLAATPGAQPADVAAAFVEACMEVLISKCRAAIKEYPVSSLVIVGGVAASPQLRAAATELCADLGIELCLPPVKWSTDNGAMIGLATWDYLANGITNTLEPVPGLGMEAF